MSTGTAFAKEELKLAGFFDKDSDYNGMVGPAVMELIEVFGKQGHSGYSAGLVANLFSKLARFEPINPIMGTPEEWFEPVDGMFQNRRCSAMFKDGKGGRPYYLDAICWRTPKGITYTGTASNIQSRQFVKAFPFTPKTFVIDVDEKEVSPDNWEFTIKDQLDLHPVEAYYDMEK